MKRHPIKSYVYVGLCIDKITGEMSGFKCLRIFVHDWIYDKKCKIQEKAKLKKQINACKKLYKKIQEQ